MRDSQSLRRTMVDTQLRTNKVTDARLLAAMAEVPRELFVPEAYRELAYIDEDIPLGGGRYLLEPMVFARLAQAAEIGGDDVILDVGCATGYSSIVLGRLARAVVGVESIPEFVQSANENLRKADQDNVVFESGDLSEGWSAQAPYDVVFVNGAVERIPERLAEQLAENGRLCAVARPEAGPGRAEIVIRSNARLSRRSLFDANVPALAEFALNKGFAFQ